MMAAKKKAPVQKVTSKDVIEALHSRYPDGKYLKILEAPQDSQRQGRKIDMLVINKWQSRGLMREAIEIKVSVSDFRTELENPAKADFWWKHCTLFWVAAPLHIAQKIRDEIPETWGLIAINGSKCRTLIKATAHTPEPLSWSTSVGVMRALDDVSGAGLDRAYWEGHRIAKTEAEAKIGTESRDSQVLSLQRSLEQIKSRVAEFEERSGLKIDEYGSGDVGEAVHLLNRVMIGSYKERDLNNAVMRLRDQADELDKIREAVKGLGVSHTQ